MIAKAIRETAIHYDSKEKLIETLCPILIEENPQFDWFRFEKAALQ